jgi:hypothetical protein
MRFLLGMDCGKDELVCSIVSDCLSWFLSMIRASVTTTDDLLPQAVDDMLALPIDEVF